MGFAERGSTSLLGFYILSEQGRIHYCNRVFLGDSSDHIHVSWLCTFRKRLGITCRHMIAVAKW